MRELSPKEKKILKQLSAQEQTLIFSDFLEKFWDVGELEFSSFQQFVQIRFNEGEKDRVVAQIVESLQLIRELEKNHFINVWSEVPIQDNTKKIGQMRQSSEPHFLPDIALASECLKYGNYKIRFNSAFYAWRKRNFKRTGYHYQVLISVGILILISLLGTDFYYNQKLFRSEIRTDHLRIEDKNKQLLSNQKLNQQIIDSLYVQGKDLVLIANEISENTQNTKEIERLIKRHSSTINQLSQQQKANGELLQKADSIIKTLKSQ